MPTPHNQAAIGAIAPLVIMPGDPLRAQFIAENFLENPQLVNTVRNMFAYTGTYKGIKVSVMGSGMGMPSIGIYAYELFQFYGVEKIIRVGSCGAFLPEIKVRDVIIAQGASTDSNFAAQYKLPGTFSAMSSFSLLHTAYLIAEKQQLPVHVGNILSSDVFYNFNKDEWKAWTNLGVLAVEMESYALFTIAANLKKQALSILTVSDSLVTHDVTTPEERQNTFTGMMKLALDTIIA